MSLFNTKPKKSDMLKLSKDDWVIVFNEKTEGIKIVHPKKNTGDNIHPVALSILAYYWMLSTNENDGNEIVEAGALFNQIYKLFDSYIKRKHNEKQNK